METVGTEITMGHAGEFIGRVIRAISLVAAVAWISVSCDMGLDTDMGTPCMTEIVIETDGGYSSKAADPDEDIVSDVNIFIFNGDNLLEEHLYLDATSLDKVGDNAYGYPVELLKGCIYSIYVCANMGFRLNCASLDELLDYRFYMAYPDDYRIGMPMSGSRTGIEFTGEDRMSVRLKRAMAKVSVRIDRGGLDDGIEFNVIRMQIGNCPRSALLFGESRAETDNGTYVSGFTRNEYETFPLNTNVSGQTSGEISLYMFENLQGEPLGNISGYEEKVFDDGDPMSGQCSYIELVAEYLSDGYYSLPGEGLVYRFYLGEGPSNFDVERNCHYHITVRPENDGLDGSGWRVDKSGLGYRGPVDMSVSPGNYIRGKIGETIYVRCNLVPDDTPLDIGLEHLEYDKERGIYDFEVDEDGKGVTLTLTGSGRGMMYFEAGYPVNDAELIVVEVDLPG